jgi:hypothetical protein
MTAGNLRTITSLSPHTAQTAYVGRFFVSSQLLSDAEGPNDPHKTAGPGNFALDIPKAQLNKPN